MDISRPYAVILFFVGFVYKQGKGLSCTIFKNISALYSSPNACGIAWKWFGESLYAVVDFMVFAQLQHMAMCFLSVVSILQKQR